MKRLKHAVIVIIIAIITFMSIFMSFFQLQNNKGRVEHMEMFSISAAPQITIKYSFESSGLHVSN